jgi:hypothetical protein
MLRVLDCGSPGLSLGPRKRSAFTKIYCLDLLCRFTCSAVRRIRRLIASCSLRANASITAMSFAVGVGLSRKSARRSQGTRKSSLSFSVDGSGTVFAASIVGGESDFLIGISSARQRPKMPYLVCLFHTVHCVFPEYLSTGADAGPLPHTPIPATDKGGWGEQKPEKVSLSLTKDGGQVTLHPLAQVVSLNLGST